MGYGGKREVCLRGGPDLALRVLWRLLVGVPIPVKDSHVPSLLDPGVRRVDVQAIR